MSGQRLLTQRLSEEERLHAVAVLSAEVAHELAGVRLVLRDILADAPLAQVDREVGQEELSRLEELLAKLRRAQLPDASLGEVPLLPMVERALAYVRASDAHGPPVELDVPATACVRASEEALALLLVSLLRAAGAGQPGAAALAVRARQEGAAILLVLEDGGPALPEPLVGRAHSVLEGLGHGSLGLDVLSSLGVAHRYGWRMSRIREGARNVCRVDLPAAGGAHAVVGRVS